MYFYLQTNFSKTSPNPFKPRMEDFDQFINFVVQTQLHTYKEIARARR